VHENEPHLPATPPPPQVPVEQVPQLRTPPQPSAAWPHCTPWLAHVCGTQAGGGGVLVSSQTRDERSKIRNSSAFSCAVIVVVVQPAGKPAPGVSPDETWMSVVTILPHCELDATPIGALNERYSVAFGTAFQPVPDAY
jgi:hypothetical protein